MNNRVEAQVVIRERVEIQTAEAPPPNTLYGQWVNLYQDYFLIRKTGFLWFYQPYLTKHAVNSFPQIPAGHHLEVRVGGRDTVFQLAGTWIDSTNWYDNHFYDSCRDSTPLYVHTAEMLRDIDYGLVAEGDTVRLYYHAEFDNPIVKVTYNTDDWWYGWGADAVLGTHNTCTPDTTDFLEWMHVWANLDTLAFRLTCEPDTIVYDEASKLTVVASYGGRQEAEFDTTRLLTYSVDSTCYCSFVAPNGDTVGSPLTGVTYADARAGKVKLIANGARDTAPLKELRIKVETSGVTGEGIICLAHLNLKILEKDGWQLWPFIDNADKGANRPGYNPRRGFTIEVKDPQGRARANQEVLLQTAFRPKSGGHDHSRSQDTIMTWALKGRFWAQHKNDNPLKGIKTGADGRLSVDSVRASMFSGSYIVYASLVSDTTVFDSVTLNVRVPDLVQFGSGDKWRLTGVPGEDSLGLNHPGNHWCTQATEDSLTAALEEFYDWRSSPAGDGVGVRVGVNDMSLAWGGDFDIKGTWFTIRHHYYHRVGTSVDIDKAELMKIVTETENGTAKTKGILTRMGQKLEEFMNKFGGMRKEENSIHFGFGGSY